MLVYFWYFWWRISMIDTYQLAQSKGIVRFSTEQVESVQPWYDSTVKVILTSGISYIIAAAHRDHFKRCFPMAFVE